MGWGWELLTFVLLGGLAFFLIIGQWTAFALGTIGMVVLYLARGPMGMLSVPSVVWNTANSYILIAVPMFLLMGEVILRSGIANYFYRGVTVLMRRLPGGLLHANIVACALFAAISGSSVATAASVGTVAIPEMTKRGYEPRLIFGSLAAGGTLGILIPPSIVMILYGALVEESIAKLFMAGLLPGILMSGLFMVYIAVRVLIDPSIAPQRETIDMDARERRQAVLHILPIIGLLLVVLGGIYAGVTTPTEAAAIGAAGAIVLAFFYGGMSWPMFRDALLSAVKTSCMVLFIIIGAQILSYALSFAGISRGLSEWIVTLELSHWVLFGALVVLYVILGFFVDGISMIYITLPVLYPVVIAAGFDPIWFGVVLTILIELGQITPPVGLNLFAIHGISGGYKFSEVVYGSLPFVGLMLLTILLLALAPEIALWLPSTM
jgi:C4-dicarboxylate transporter, DctM subunit